MTINLVVVEAHHHILEHIHYTLRQRRRSSAKTTKTNIPSWSMLHFDSHPDLACPETIPAAACFTPRREWHRKSKTCEQYVQQNTPITTANTYLDQNAGKEENKAETKNLYDLLDTSRGGIAEWILPLVLAADLKTVFWMKNAWCHQFENGYYPVNIGVNITGSPDNDPDAIHNNHSKRKRDVNMRRIQSFLDVPEEALLRTSFLHPYYMDDRSVVDDNCLALKQTMELFVSQIDDNDSNGDSYARNDKRKCENTKRICQLFMTNNDHTDDIPSTNLPTFKARPDIKTQTAPNDLRKTQEKCNNDDGINSNTNTAAAGAPGNSDVNNNLSEDTDTAEGEDWLLDVCLDYFYCANPFLDELNGIDANIANLLLRAVNETRFRKYDFKILTGRSKDKYHVDDPVCDAHQHNVESKFGGNVNGIVAQRYAQDLDDFNCIAKKLMQNLDKNAMSRKKDHNNGNINGLSLSNSSTVALCNNNNNNGSIFSSLLTQADYNKLCSLYDLPIEGKRIWEELTFAIVAQHTRQKSEQQKGRGNFMSPQDSTEGRKVKVSDTVAQIILHALPNITLPHTAAVDGEQNEYGSLENENGSAKKYVDLPPMVLSRIKTFGNYLRKRRWIEIIEKTETVRTVRKDEKCRDDSQQQHYQQPPRSFKTPPMFISIARSTDDGYTPSSIVEPLQKAVLQEIHSVYCNCNFWNIIGNHTSNHDEKNGIPNISSEGSRCQFNVLLDYGEYEGSSLEDV
mmetsp:Transcript_20632/g.25324  ORF Transcript_20632/g.25324 Transcript_20632/m.25324 type:complete len:739 (-) Transcript_20632:108-2324(-)